jgi:biotin carboxyl carrier protein
MKYQVKIQGKFFKVKIDNLHSQPIIASVDGELIEVWVEHHNGITQLASVEAVKIEGAPARPSPRLLPGVAEPLKAGTDGLAGNNKAIRAPIPGTIISVTAREGNEVAVGQELCVLEAMKMKNAIRSPRAGVIASVHVSPGQTVQHRDVLMEFVD